MNYPISVLKNDQDAKPSRTKLGCLNYLQKSQEKIFFCENYFCSLGLKGFDVRCRFEMRDLLRNFKRNRVGPFDYNRHYNLLTIIQS